MAIDKLQTDALSNTVTANIASVAIGANVSINSSTFFVGNSTANTLITAAGGFTQGANVSINSSTFVVGSGQINATGITLPSNFGVSSNTTNLLENRNGQLFFNGRRVDLVNEYVAVYGYQLGGFAAGAYISTADRITFSTGVYAASTISNVSEARFAGSGSSDVSVYGYTNGGYNGSVVVTTCDRTTFATSVTAAYSAGALAAARYDHFSVSDGSVYGYVLGGYNSAFTVLSSVERRAFSTGVTAAISATLSAVRTSRMSQSLSDGSIYGYTMGGSSTGGVAGGVTTTDRLTFSTSAIAASTASNVSVARSDIGTVSDGAVYGYTCGGYNTGSPAAPVTTGDRTTFSTSATAALTSANLSGVRAGLNGVSDGATYGYFSGGESTGASSYVTTTDRITFSTSVLAAVTASNLPAARSFTASAFSDGAV